MATRGLCCETLGFELKTSGSGETLGSDQPVANPWPTHDLPMETREKKHGFRPQNMINFLQ